MMQSAFQNIEQKYIQIVQDLYCMPSVYRCWFVGWFCFTSHRQRGYVETAPPFTAPREGRGARVYTVPTGNRAPGRRVVVHHSTAAQRQLHCIQV